jgi:hypothetical protein
MSFQGHVEKGLVVLDQPLPLPDGTPVRVEPILEVPTAFWQSHSLDELARQQGVTAPTSPDDLLGGWPADDLNDDFEQALRNWRNCELEQGP